MKLSAMLCTLVVVLIAFVLTADHASAQAVNYNSSKSNSGNVADTKMNNNAGAGKGQSGKVNNTTTRSNTQHN